MSTKGQKAGWTLGGLGAIIWIPLLSVIFLFKGNYAGAILGAGFFILGVLYLIYFAPWKHPKTQFWKIYLGLLTIIILAAVVFLYLWYPKSEFSGTFNIFSIFWIFPLFLPIFLLGNKTWKD